MLIDSHVHIGFDKPPETQVRDLLSAMRRAGVGHALVYAGDLIGLPTERLVRILGPYRDRLSAVGTVSPLIKNRPTPARVTKWLDSGLVHGLKFYTGYQHFYPADRRLRPYLRLLAKRELPAVFHSGDTYGAWRGAKLKFSHPLAVDDLAVEMPDLKIVIAHLGSPWSLDCGEVVYKNRNVYADCSGFVYGKFDVQARADFREVTRDFVRVAGSTEKVMYGSDWPIGDMVSYAAAAKSLISRERGFLGATAAKIYKLKSF